MTRVMDVFKEWDADGNGQISVLEFRAACRHLDLPLGKEEVEKIFSVLDPDGSGSLSFKELNRALRSHDHAAIDARLQQERAQRTYRESTRHLQPEMPALPSDLLAWGGSAPPPSVPVRSTFKTLFKQQQLVQKREEERAEAAALESKATKRLANMASIAASKSMRSMPGLAR